jgi:hypothetical protein
MLCVSWQSRERSYTAYAVDDTLSDTDYRWQTAQIGKIRSLITRHGLQVGNGTNRQNEIINNIISDNGCQTAQL